ncbi:DsbA family protein [Sphingomonas sp.]|jgi:protein-disulfide isomerase|uniref:DsbA family protein n=1 Tax=Sphingomonas sp. TaxID=28214 RepID=UPI002ED8A6B8
MKSVLKFLAPTLALAACSGGDGGNVTSAAPVAAVTAPANQPWAETVAKTDEGYLLGNPDAPVKLVEYGARLCPACKGFATTGFEPLIKNYVSTGKVSFEFRDFLIHGPAELGLAALARCADKAAFFVVLEQTYANQDALNQAMMAVSPAQQQALQSRAPTDAVTGWTEAIGGIDFMKQRGLPDAKARACLADQKTLDAITKVTQDRGADGTVTGTPTLLVNGNKIDGISWPDVEKALKAAGA